MRHDDLPLEFRFQQVFVGFRRFKPVIFREEFGMSAFKTPQEIHSPTPVIFPSAPTFENFRKAFSAAPFGKYVMNTLLVAAVVTGTTVILCAMAGYGFGRLPFPGREAIFVLFILAMALPGEVTLIPRFLIAKNFPFFGGNNWLGKGGIGLIDRVADRKSVV